MSGAGQLLREIIGTQYFAVLNSLGDGLPYSNLVSFAVTADLKTLVFATDRNTRKYRNIRDNKNVSLLIDNRTNRPSDIEEAVAITAIGVAGEEPGNNNNLKELFLGRHPQLKSFVDDTESALIKVKMSEYIIAGFDRTQRVMMTE